MRRGHNDRLGSAVRTGINGKWHPKVNLLSGKWWYVSQSTRYAGVQAGQLAGYVQIFNVAAHPSS